MGWLINALRLEQPAQKLVKKGKGSYVQATSESLYQYRRLS